MEKENKCGLTALHILGNGGTTLHKVKGSSYMLTVTAMKEIGIWTKHSDMVSTHTLTALNIKVIGRTTCSMAKDMKFGRILPSIVASTSKERSKVAEFTTGPTVQPMMGSG